VEKYGRDGQATVDSIIRRMRIVCWITKATDTHSEYVIGAVFPRQQWIHVRCLHVILYAHYLSSFCSQKRPGSSRAHPISYTVDDVGSSQRYRVPRPDAGSPLQSMPRLRTRNAISTSSYTFDVIFD